MLFKSLEKHWQIFEEMIDLDTVTTVAPAAFLSYFKANKTQQQMNQSLSNE
jgi:hypothetical protein